MTTRYTSEPPKSLELQEECMPSNYDQPSGNKCECGREMTIGEWECFGHCFKCYDMEE